MLKTRQINCKVANPNPVTTCFSKKNNGAKPNSLYHLLLEEEYLCCVQDVAFNVLPNIQNWWDRHSNATKVLYISIYLMTKYGIPLQKCCILPLENQWHTTVNLPQKERQNQHWQTQSHKTPQQKAVTCKPQKNGK